MTDQRQELQGYVNDMLAVEREIHDAFRRHKNDEHVRGFTTASRLLAETEERVDRHIAALEQCARTLGGESAVKKAVGAIMGAASGLFAKVRDDKVSRMLRDDYTALSFASVCYEMLHTTALAMRDANTADLALRHLRDYTPVIMQLGEELPRVVTRELSAEGKAPGGEAAAEQAVQNTREAWQAASAQQPPT